jgi:ureidoacrylate peracid hydrolase
MAKKEEGYSRRQMMEMSLGLSALALVGGVGSVDARGMKRAPARMLTLEAKPEPIALDTAKTAVIVVDMQNDFGSEGGMLHRAGLDITLIRAAVAPTARVLAAARREGIKVIYLKMAFKPDLSDAGAADSVNRVRHVRLGVGSAVRAPNGAESRILIRNTWNTDILSELTPEPGETVLYKNRFSGFYQTELDAVLRQIRIKHLIITGCLTGTCVEATIRDAMYRDYLPVALSDCTANPIRADHESALSRIETFFGWVSNSEEFIRVLEAHPA